MLANKALLQCGPDSNSFAVSVVLCSSSETIAELSCDRGHVACATWLAVDNICCPLP